MKNRINTWLVIIILIGAAFSVGYIVAPKEETRTTETGLTIVDDLGRTVTISKTPERIVSLSASATEILYALGCGDKIVGVCKYAKYPPEVKEKPVVGGVVEANLEMIIGIGPDLILAWPATRDTLKTLEEEVPIVYLHPKSVDDVLDTISLLGLIVNETAEASKLTTEMQTKIDEITSKTRNLNKTQRPLVYFEMTPMKTVSQGTFTNELIFMAGGINIAVDEPVKYPILSSEYIIERNPDVIIVLTGGSYRSSIEDIKNRRGWQEINAVKNDRIYEIDWEFVTSNPRIVLGLEQFAMWFHPELFGGE